MKTLAVLVSPGTLADGAVVDLDEPERHHLKVRRAGPGDEVLVLDGAGSVARGLIADRGAVSLIGEVRHVPRPAATVLAVGAGDRERFLALAERCTELGVTHLVPLVTERSQAVDGRFRDAAVDRARRRAREACKQCENAWATFVAESCSLHELLARQPGLRWFVAGMGGAPCPAIGGELDVGWIIGPEGGLAPDELHFAVAQLTATGVRLGSSVLRFDTAAVAAAVITDDRRTATKE